ncbi:MAG: PilN domain-containing protein [Betaproteobacteria bacterium]
MSARINLLPHREERRKRARQHFYILSGGTAIIGVLIIGAMHTYVANLIDVQEDRNRFLKAEITKLDKEIAEINSLKDQIQALLARKNIIETLQADRAQTVHLLDELAKQTPDGVYLRSVSQKGQSLSIDGYAQSNAMVSTLMRNIEASRHLARPELIEVKAATVDKKRLSEFNMNLSLKREAPKTPPKPEPKAPAKKG